MATKTKRRRKRPTRRRFRVAWEIDCENEPGVRTFKKAAEWAHAVVQQIANVYVVEDLDTGDRMQVDLWDGSVTKGDGRGLF